LANPLQSPAIEVKVDRITRIQQVELRTHVYTLETLEGWYTANGLLVSNCRPPGNRDPKTKEVQACWALLQRQLRILQPQVIVTLGRFSAQRLTLNYGPLSAIREIDGLVCTLGDLEIPVFPIWHPSYVGRQMRMAGGNPEWKPQAKAVYQDCTNALQKAVALTS